MPIDFEDTYPEYGQSIGFGQNRLVADSEQRDENSLPSALNDDRRRFHLFHKGRALVRKDISPTATFDAKMAARFEADMESAVLLGVDEAGPRLAANVEIEGEEPAEPFQLYDMRSLLYSASVSDEEASAIARAASLLHWHRTNRYCGRCGTASASRIGGYRRDCDSCDLKIFPRTDPVVIMLAIDGDQCLLGRSPHFPAGWYSTLAGFVEPGETIEAAVRRETFEESGIRIRAVRYHTSQPWPFPHSLMIGMYGEATSTDIVFDRTELEDCQWFSKADIAAMVRDEHPKGYKCPPTKAIAHSLIRTWLES